jgi:hypothetical protein
MKNPITSTVIILLLAVSSLSAATLYVSLESTNPTPPYTNWTTAAPNIQEAVGAAAAGDVVLVTNGVYAGGVAVTKPLTLLGVNGPQFTVINGGGTNRCVTLTNSASLTGFTLTGGYTYGGDGGGVWCVSPYAFLTNCVIVGNSATLTDTGNGGNGGGACGVTLYNCTLTGNSVSGIYHSMVNGYSCGGGAAFCTSYNCTLANNSGHYGGGAYGCTLYNCMFTANHAPMGGGAFASGLNNCTLTGNFAVPDKYGFGWGGGAFQCYLVNCTVTGNSAQLAGGIYGYTHDEPSLVYNSIVYFNSAVGGESDYESFTCALNYCCTTLLPANGVGNITNAPLFVDYASGNLRPQSNSPCINAGNNAYVSTSTDLDGRPRIVGGTVDIGAYEFQGQFNQWLQQYALPTDGSADFIDSDGDGLNNWQEWVCGTDPKNRLSALRLLSATPTSTNSTVTWQSVAGVNYFLERSGNLASPFTLLATNIVGQAGTTSYTDTNAAGAGPFFYRVGVQPW